MISSLMLSILFTPPKIYIVSTDPAIIYTQTVPTRYFANRKMAFKISSRDLKSHWFQQSYNLLSYFLDINTTLSTCIKTTLTITIHLEESLHARCTIEVGKKKWCFRVNINARSMGISATSAASSPSLHQQTVPVSQHEYRDLIHNQI